MFLAPSDSTHFQRKSLSIFTQNSRADLLVLTLEFSVTVEGAECGLQMKKPVVEIKP
jgi:hypothetical protein